MRGSALAFRHHEVGAFKGYAAFVIFQYIHGCAQILKETFVDFFLRLRLLVGCSESVVKDGAVIVAYTMKGGYFQNLGNGMVKRPFLFCIQRFRVGDGGHDISVGIHPHGAGPAVVQIVGGVVGVERARHVVEISAEHIGHQVLYDLVLPVGAVHTRLIDDAFLNGGERYEVGLVIVFLQFVCIGSFGAVEIGKVIGTR